MDQSEITRILESGEPDALQRVVPMIYEELRALAASRLRMERADHTLQPTALVNELFLKLAASENLSVKNRGHFLATAAGCIRQILVDHARVAKAEKRGSNWQRVTLDSPMVSSQSLELDLLSLHEAVRALSEKNERQGQVAEMRIFGGMTGDDIAAHLNLSRTMITKEWRFARAWLSRALSG
ncbi:MAG: ECF-type sigma factor [Phycisphaerae bacterium]